MSRGPALTLKELVVDHVRTTLEPEDWQWQPSLTEALEGLTAAQAAWKPAPERNSIWQIVRHLILWKRGVLDAWNGNPPDDTQLSAADWQPVAGSEADWQRDRRTLLEMSTQFLTRAQGLGDADVELCRRVRRLLVAARGEHDQERAAHAYSRRNSAPATR